MVFGFNNVVIYVYNLKIVIESSFEFLVIIMEFYCIFLGYIVKIISVLWSLYYDGRLVFVFYDGIVQVWDVFWEEFLCNF